MLHQFAEGFMRIEPFVERMYAPTAVSIRGKEEVELEWGGKLVFYNCIVGGVIDARFLPSIQKGVMEVMEEGPLTGSYIRDVRVIVYDGKMHPVDSNDIAFKLAGMNAFKQAFLDARPKLLEPLYDLEIQVPQEVMGEVMSDLQARRAIITGIDSAEQNQLILAKVPLAELHTYSSTLRSITQGRASYHAKYAEYAPVPENKQHELVKEGVEELEMA